jgi:hypothetical protein
MNEMLGSARAGARYLRRAIDARRAGASAERAGAPAPGADEFVAFGSAAKKLAPPAYHLRMKALAIALFALPVAFVGNRELPPGRGFSADLSFGLFGAPLSPGRHQVALEMARWRSRPIEVTIAR